MISSVFVQRFEWRGISVEISYQPQWLGMTEMCGAPTAHLTVRSVSPLKAALPITETGYLSHFLPNAEVLTQGGPVGFVRNWLDVAAQFDDWRRQEEGACQLSFL